MLIVKFIQLFQRFTLGTPSRGSAPVPTPWHYLHPLQAAFKKIPGRSGYAISEGLWVLDPLSKRLKISRIANCTSLFSVLYSCSRLQLQAALRFRHFANRSSSCSSSRRGNWRSLCRSKVSLRILAFRPTFACTGQHREWWCYLHQNPTIRSR